LGELIERSFDYEYKQSFDCQKIENLAHKTQNVLPLSPKDRIKTISRMETVTGVLSRNESQYLTTSSTGRLDINKLAEKVRKQITREECEHLANTDPSSLRLPGNTAYGKEDQFENQARAALRVSHFMSSFLQLVEPKDVFAEFRVPDKPLTPDQVIGEALSTLMSDRQIQGIGIWFDRNQFSTQPHQMQSSSQANNGANGFTNRRQQQQSQAQNPYFAPYAYRLERNTRNFHVIDLANHRRSNDDQHFTQNESFQKLKTRWMVGTENLDTFTLKAHIRFNSSGLNLIKYDRYPLEYLVPNLEHGYWSAPFYDCSIHNQWLISYSSPIFGWDKLKLRVEFKGIVTVNMRLAELDANQCDGEQFYTSNAFKETHKCDRRSTRCVPVPGRKFESGGYKCECKQGYEYPFNNPTTYIDGQMMEAEYLNVLQDRPSRFESLTCRLVQI